ncbi:MAG: winged helix-turn-helix transcriptional regulator [Pseudonocardiaceae bacterium]
MSDPLPVILELIRLKWSVAILTTLADRPLRYTDLQRVLTIASGETVYSRPLTRSLRRLQKAGLVEHPPAHDHGAVYRLTPLGNELAGLLDDLGGWGEQHRSNLGI